MDLLTRRTEDAHQAQGGRKTGVALGSGAEDLSASRRGRLLIDLGVLVGFVVLSVLATWPLVAHLRDAVLDPGDPVFTSWSLPWVLNALVHHPTELFQANIFHPEPYPLAYADHMLGIALVGAPFWFLTHDGILTNNVVTLVLPALAGWTAYLLARELTRRTWPSIVAGVIFAFSPYTFVHLGHTNLLGTYPLALTWLFTLKTIRRGRVADAALLAAAWTLSMMSSWYYLAYATAIVVIVAIGELISKRKEIRLVRVVVLLHAALFVVLAVAAVFAMPYFRVQSEYPQAARGLDEVAHYMAGPSAFLVVSGENRLWGEALASYREQGGVQEKVMFNGFVPLALAVIGVGVAFARRRFALVASVLGVAACGVTLAFGPYQDVFGREDVQMPFYYLYTYLPGFHFMRSVARSQVLVSLSVAVLAAVALAAVPRRLNRPLVAAAVGVIVAVELATAPLRLVGAPRPSAAHDWLASAPLPGAVLELPTAEFANDGIAGGTHLRDAPHMASSTRHWRELVNGYSGFVPPTYVELVRALRAFPDAESLRLLRDRGVVYVLVHKQEVRSTPWHELADPSRRFRELEAVFDDGRVVVYRILPP